MDDTEYLAPESLKEAISLLAKYREKATVSAGGTDLLVQMKNRERSPAVLVNLHNIRELEYIRYDEKKGLEIGALTGVNDIAESTVVRSRFGVLAQAAGMLGTPAIRDRATLCGNLCNAAPSADTAPALLVLNAKIKIMAKNGTRLINAADFFTGPGKTVVKPGEMVVAVQVPEMPPKSGAVYLKHTRVKGADLAVAGAAALVSMDGDVMKEVRIALGAVAPTPIRAGEAENILSGKKLDEKLLEEAGQAAADRAKPIDDVRGSAEYRRKLVAVLVKRAVKQAAEQAKSEVR